MEVNAKKLQKKSKVLIQHFAKGGIRESITLLFITVLKIIKHDFIKKCRKYN